MEDKGPELIVARHEQNAAFMAQGVGRITGKPGVVSGNASRTGDSGSKSGGGDSKPANNSTSFSSEEDHFGR